MYPVIWVRGERLARLTIFDRFKLAFVNQRHITEASLNEAIATVVNTYVQFPLQKALGLEHAAAADGMKWDLYPQTLI